jgi:hypothetical protein
MEYGICYSPTWSTFKPPYKNSGPDAQFSDVDFFNVAFEGLWKSRGDLRMLGGAGFTLVRLYNWGPTRGWNGSVGTAHLPFLDHAKERGLKVIVPVSNYFLSSDQYAWGTGKDGVPDSNYSFASAPQSIQQALMNFVSSVSPRPNELHSAVHSFAVANEIDYNTMADQGGPPVEPSVRLARALWWIVNLQARLAKIGAKAPLTIVISNADQGNDPAPHQNNLYPYWFQAFVDGVKAGDPYPKGTVVGTPTKAFANTCKGLSAFDWYKDWFYNSVCIYQYGKGLQKTLGQYDKWTKGSNNSTNWPGQQFLVPLLLTEIGVRHGPHDKFPNDPTDDKTFTDITRDIAEAIRVYYNPASRLMGYCLYEFNDEAWLGANWGIFRNGPVAEQKSTGPTKVSYGTFPAVNYPVEKLTSLRSAQGVRVIDRLSEIFSGDAERLYIVNYGSTALVKFVKSQGGGGERKVPVGPTSFATVNTKDVTGALPWHIMNSPTLTAATVDSLPAVAAFDPNVLTARVAYPYLTAVAYPCGMIC